MIDKKEVTEYFNRLAPEWDAKMIKSDEKINRILDNAGVHPGTDVLDAGCGTGVLIPYYLKRKVSSVTAIDISSEMVRIARDKFSSEVSVTVLCGDVEETLFSSGFDCVVIYNAFPHFPDPERLIYRLSTLLRPGGILTVAHGMSREKTDARHHGPASRVSNGLMSAADLAALFSRYLTVSSVISDENMYQVAGRKI